MSCHTAAPRSTWRRFARRVGQAALLATVLSFLACSDSDLPPEPSRLVVIGIDSLSWQLLDPLLAAGELPHFTRLIERGFQAEMETVLPLISPPNWTSIATGRSPEAHGIQSFFVDRRRIRVPTVWERLAAAGGRVGVYDFLLTWPPRPLPNGFMIPGWLRRDDVLWPTDLEQRLGRRPHTYTALDMGHLEATVAEIDRELERKPRDFVDLFDTFELDAAFVTFYAVDVISHRFFHAQSPEAFDPPIPFDPRFEGLLEKTLRRLDEALGLLIGGLNERDHVVVVSDHGARASNPVPRLWGFAADKMLRTLDLGPEDGVFPVNGFVEAAFKISEGPVEDREEAVKRLADFGRSLHSQKGEPIFQVKVVFPGEVSRSADALTPLEEEVLATNQPAHAFVFFAADSEVLNRLWPSAAIEGPEGNQPVSHYVQPHDFTGDHHPTALFLAAGPALKQGRPRGQVSVLDVAPLLLYLAGQPIPDDLEGASPAPLLTPEYLRSRPLRTVTAAEALRLPPEANEASGLEGDEELRKRLRALGYVQ